jgi:hypothetical protein
MFTRNDLKQLLRDYKVQVYIEHGFYSTASTPNIIIRLKSLRSKQMEEDDHRSKGEEDCLHSVLTALFAPLIADLKSQSQPSPTQEQLMRWFCEIKVNRVSKEISSEDTIGKITIGFMEKLCKLFQTSDNLLRNLFLPFFEALEAELKISEQETKFDLPDESSGGGGAHTASALVEPEADDSRRSMIYFNVLQIQWFLVNYILEKRSALKATGLNEEHKEFGEALRFYLEGVLFQAASKVMKQVRDEIKKEAQTSETIKEHYAQIEGLYLFLKELFSLRVVIDDSTLLILMQEFLAMVEFSKKNPVILAGFDKDSHLMASTEATAKTIEFKTQRSQMFRALSSDAFSAIQKSTNALLKILLMDPEAMHALESFIEAVKRASLDLKKKLPIISAPTEVFPSPEPSTAQTPLLPPRSLQQVPSSVPRTGSQADRRITTATSMGRVASSVGAALSCCCRFFPRSAAEAAQRLPNPERKAVTAGYGGIDDTPMRREPGPS